MRRIGAGVEPTPIAGSACVVNTVAVAHTSVVTATALLRFMDPSGS